MKSVLARRTTTDIAVRGPINAAALRKRAGELEDAWPGALRQEYFAFPTWTDSGLRLGASTRLARRVAGEEGGLLAKLSIAYGKAWPPSILKSFQLAERRFREGDLAMSAMLVALCGVTKFEDRRQAKTLHILAGLLDGREVNAVEAMEIAEIDSANVVALGKYSVDEARVPAGNARESGRWTRDGAQVAANSPAVPGPPADAAHAEQMRRWIALIAESYVDSQKWITEGTFGPFGPKVNKCNIFVDFVLTQAGIAPPRMIHGRGFDHPPTAGQWADPHIDVPGWRMLGAGEVPEAGDIVAQKIGYTNASGHVMFVGPDDTFIGTGEHGNGPVGTIEKIPKRISLTDDSGSALGPPMFRRWMGR